MKKLGYRFAQRQVREPLSQFFATAKPVASIWEVRVNREPLSRGFIAFWKKTEK